MVLLDGQAVFGKGLHDLRVGATELRFTQTHAPQQTGVTVHADGVAARELVVVGWLVADTRPSLDLLVTDIEQWIDGCEHTLSHETRTYEHVIVAAFRPGLVRRIGPRVGMKFEVQMLQLRP